MLLVKLGGSVITVKSKYRTLRGPDLSRLAASSPRRRTRQA